MKTTLKLVVCLLASAFLVGCAGLPSVCDTIPEGDSIGCAAADKLNVRIEDIGSAIMIANAIAIERGYYTKEEAIELCEQIQGVLGNPISYSLLVRALTNSLGQYPGLDSVVASYASVFDIDKEIYEVDRKALVKWLGDRIADMRG